MNGSNPTARFGSWPQGLYEGSCERESARIEATKAAVECAKLISAILDLNVEPEREAA
jgi:hypothetical protein